MVNKYAELIVESHGEDCLWRKRGCDGKEPPFILSYPKLTVFADSLLRISFSNATANVEALRERYDELCARKSFLPYDFNLKLPEDFDLDGIVAQLPNTFFTDPPPKEASEAESPNKAALALALMGWQGLSNPRIGAVPNSASCHTCLRRLGLWMFKSKEVGPDNEIIVPAPMDFLDPVKEHRFFCPWKNPQGQRLSSSKPGREGDLTASEMLARSIKNESYLRGVLDGSGRRKSTATGTDIAPGTPSRDTVATPRTPGTPNTSISTGAPDTPMTTGGLDDEDDAARDAKDKERWARLRRVKSLFDGKGGKKLRRTASRPGTAHSTKSSKSTNQQ